MSRVWFFVCLFIIVVGTVVTVGVLNAGRNSLAISNSFDGNTADEKYANFRNVRVGKIKSGVLYRSASPVDNSKNRASMADSLMGDAGIRYVVNLADNEDGMNSFMSKDDYNSQNYLSLYEAGNVVLLHMDMKYKERKFEEKLVRGLTAMAKNEGPYLVHCLEGKDRTGYVIMVLEALTGASYEEMVDDYMASHDNYYGVNPDDEPERYKVIKKEGIDSMLHYLIGDEGVDLASVSDYEGYAKDYLKSIGVNEEEIQRLVERLES